MRSRSEACSLSDFPSNGRSCGTRNVHGRLLRLTQYEECSVFILLQCPSSSADGRTLVCSDPLQCLWLDAFSPCSSYTSYSRKRLLQVDPDLASSQASVRHTAKHESLSIWLPVTWMPAHVAQHHCQITEPSQVNWLKHVFSTHNYE